MENADDDKESPKQNVKPIESIDHESKKNKVNLRNLIILGTLCFGAVLVTSCDGIQGPFYPQEAEAKGTTPTVYGLVQGSYAFVIFLVAPGVGKLIVSVGNINHFIICGAAFVGVCLILFGMLTYVHDTLTFVALSFTLRIAEGIGNSFFRVAYWTLGPSLFPEKATTIFSIMRTCSGLGLMFGPTFGGILFDLGGFKLPFIVLGCMFGLDALILFCTLPKYKPKEKVEKTQIAWKFWLNVGVWIYFYDSIVCICIYASVSTTLEPHIRSFELSGVQTGLVFAVAGIVVAICSPICGWLLDREEISKLVVLVGAVCLLLSQVLIVPMPFLHLKKELWLIYLARILFGLGFVAKTIGAFSAMVNDSVERGYEKGVTLYGFVSSSTISSQSLGLFLGPSISGYAYDQLGYMGSVLVLTYAEIVALVAIVLYYIFRKVRSKTKGVQVNIEDASIPPEHCTHL